MIRNKTERLELAKKSVLSSSLIQKALNDIKKAWDNDNEVYNLCFLICINSNNIRSHSANSNTKLLKEDEYFTSFKPKYKIFHSLWWRAHDGYTSGYNKRVKVLKQMIKDLEEVGK